MTAVRLVLALLGISLVIVAFLWAMRILMVKAANPPRLACLIFDGVRNRKSG